MTVNYFDFETTKNIVFNAYSSANANNCADQDQQQQQQQHRNQEQHEKTNSLNPNDDKGLSHGIPETVANNVSSVNEATQDGQEVIEASMKSKRTRTVFTIEQLAALEREFNDSKSLPSSRRAEIASRLGLSESKVNTWFQNRRVKLKREINKNNVQSTTATTLNSKANEEIMSTSDNATYHQTAVECMSKHPRYYYADTDLGASSQSVEYLQPIGFNNSVLKSPTYFSQSPHTELWFLDTKLNDLMEVLGKDLQQCANDNIEYYESEADEYRKFHIIEELYKFMRADDPVCQNNDGCNVCTQAYILSA